MYCSIPGWCYGPETPPKWPILNHIIFSQDRWEIWLCAICLMFSKIENILFFWSHRNLGIKLHDQHSTFGIDSLFTAESTGNQFQKCYADHVILSPNFCAIKKIKSFQSLKTYYISVFLQNVHKILLIVQIVISYIFFVALEGLGLFYSISWHMLKVLCNLLHLI